MQESKKPLEEAPDQEAISDKNPTDQHPDWHPFAVWKSQIRNEQLGATGTYQVLDVTKIADA